MTREQEEHIRRGLAKGIIIPYAADFLAEIDRLRALLAAADALADEVSKSADAWEDINVRNACERFWRAEPQRK